MTASSLCCNGLPGSHLEAILTYFPTAGLSDDQRAIAWVKNSWFDIKTRHFVGWHRHVERVADLPTPRIADLAAVRARSCRNERKIDADRLAGGRNHDPV